MFAVSRLLLLGTTVLRLDADEAVTGEVARRILDGQLYLYFPGDRAGEPGYLGALEQYLQAAVLGVLPDNAFTLRLPQVALSLACCYLVYDLALLVFRDRTHALLAAALFTAGPLYNLVWNLKSQIYASAMLIGLAGVSVALRALPDRAHTARWAALFGFCCGLGFWQSWLSAFLLLPAAVWVLGSWRGRWQALLPPAAAGAFLGVAPTMITTLTDGLPSFFSSPFVPSTAAERADNLFGPVLSMFLGLSVSPEQPTTRLAPPALGVALALALLGALVYRQHRGLLALVRLRDRDRQPLDLVVAVALLVPLLYLSSRFAWIRHEPRYLYPLYGVLPVLLVALVPRPSAGRRLRTWAVGLGLLALVTASSVLAVRQVLAAGGRGGAAAGVLVRTETLPEVLDAMREEGVDAAYADFWLAQPLQFLGDGVVDVAPFYIPRLPDVSERVAAEPSPAYLAPGGAPAEQMAQAIMAAGSTFRTRTVAGIVMFLDIRPGLHPTVEANDPRQLGLQPSA